MSDMDVVGDERRHNLHGDIKSIDGGTNRILTEQILYNILRLKTEGSQPSFDAFTTCDLIVQSVFKSSRKLKFRVQLTWKGVDVKLEIYRLYGIPPEYQVLIINGKTVSDEEVINDFDFKQPGQIIYIFLTKHHVERRGSGIRIRDLIDDQEATGTQETVPDSVYDATINTETDCIMSQSPSKRKRRNKRR